ncbi:MAG TPA: DNRLRE domain-containing protein [Chitinophagales bacterium]|nr:DNRLRE domain-containing protein [Chitinophagales bacterium]
MKKEIMIVFAIMFTGLLHAQTTLVLQPDAAAGKDALINSATPNTGYSTHEEVSSYNWTNQGNWTSGRSLLEFDLSQLPAGAIITNARLSLWCNTTTQSTMQLHAGTNTSYLRRVTSAWIESGVNWSNQPSTTAQSEVTLATSTSSTQDYLNIDVTALYQDILSSGNNYGLMLQLVTESGLSSLVFASSDYTDAAKRPKLEITYTLPSANCIILQPDATTGKDALVNSATPNTGYGTHEEVSSYNWTNQGNWTTGRSLLEFDLSQLPNGAVITSATLSLWCNTTTQSTMQLHAGTNASYLRRVTSAWTESGVNWSNQPSTSTQNEVTLATSTSSTQDYLNIDVTALYQDILNSGNNYGLMLQLVTESGLSSLVFASSDYSNAAKRPKLEICYTLSTSPCVTLQPDAATGKDALINSATPNIGYATHEEVSSYNWTSQGNWTTGRSLLEFDLSQIPANSTITDARLSLWCNTTTQSTLQLHAGTNASYLRRVTQPWTENGVNWTNQPPTSTQNEVLLPTSTTSTEDYLNLDVTALYQDIINSGNNYGLMLQLVTESGFNSLVFASSDYTNALKRPKLEICYNVTTGLNYSSIESNSIKVYPNPSSGMVTIALAHPVNGASRVSIYNLLGEEVWSTMLYNGQQQLTFSTYSFAKGAYLIKVNSEGTTYITRVVFN